MYTITITETIETTNWTKRSYEQITTDEAGEAVWGYPEQVPERKTETREVAKLVRAELDINAVVAFIVS